MVTIKSEAVKQFRKEHALSLHRFYARLAIHRATGKKILTGMPVSLFVAKKVANAMGIKAKELIQSWNDSDEREQAKC